MLASLPRLVTSLVLLFGLPAVANGSQPADPFADSAVLGPTAFSQPRGSVTLRTYDGLLYAATVGISDRVQITAGGGVIPGHPTWAGLASVKAGLLATDRLRLAALASTFGHYHGYTKALVYGAGLVGSACLDQGCRLITSALAYGGRQWHEYEGRSDTDTAVILGGSVVAWLASPVALVVEGYHASPGAGTGAPDTPRAYGGLRLAWGRFALDAGAMLLVPPYGRSEQDPRVLPGGTLGVRL